MTTFNVRVIGYRGVRQMTDVNPKQLNTSQVNVLVQPYEWAQLLQLTAGAQSPVSSLAVANDLATVLRIEVPDTFNIRYEINTTGRSGGAVVAGNNSPSISGRDQYDWTPGSTISVVDAAAYP